MAHAFAAHFLMPARAVGNELRLLGYADEDLASPEVAYRLALSFGTSYRAMCFHLATLKLIDSDSANRIAGVAPITTKRQLLGATSLPDSWADVWHVGPESGVRALHLRRGDHLLVDLPGRGADGYVWRPTDDTIRATMVAPAVVAVRPGSPSPQRLHLIWDGQGDEVSFEHVRPWSPDTRLDEFSLTVATASKPPMGLSPLDRPRAA